MLQETKAHPPVQTKFQTKKKNLKIQKTLMRPSRNRTTMFQTKAQTKIQKTPKKKNLKKIQKTTKRRMMIDVGSVSERLT